MEEKYVNKVVVGGDTIIDLTVDNVQASDVRIGVTFHAPDGSRQVGTNTGGGGTGGYIYTINDFCDIAFPEDSQYDDKYIVGYKYNGSLISYPYIFVSEYANLTPPYNHIRAGLTPVTMDEYPNFKFTSTMNCCGIGGNKTTYGENGHGCIPTQYDPETYLKYVVVDEDSVGFIVTLENAFLNYEALEKAIIPSTTVRANSAFQGCSSLSKPPVLPDTLLLAQWMFASCISLSEAPVLPDHITNCTAMFSQCKSLRKAPYIPASVTSIETMFAGSGIEECPSLAHLTNITSMYYTFIECVDLLEAPELPQNIESLLCAFYGCESMTKPPSVIPESCTNMNYAFEGCTSLASAPVIPENVEDIRYAFYRCTSLNSVIRFSENISNVPQASSYTFPSNVTSILVPSAMASAFYAVWMSYSFRNNIIGVGYN